jgi:hypothetical protein
VEKNEEIQFLSTDLYKMQNYIRRERRGGGEKRRIKTIRADISTAEYPVTFLQKNTLLHFYSRIP